MDHSVARLLASVDGVEAERVDEDRAELDNENPEVVQAEPEAVVPLGNPALNKAKQKAPPLASCPHQSHVEYMSRGERGGG